MASSYSPGTCGECVPNQAEMMKNGGATGIEKEGEGRPREKGGGRLNCTINKSPAILPRPQLQEGTDQKEEKEEGKGMSLFFLRNVLGKDSNGTKKSAANELFPIFAI